jgi:RNA polymerase sigma factor (sigma-70 family)
MSASLQCVLHHIRRLVAGRRVNDLPDGELLDRFARQRDEDAFAELLRRHGPMVLQVGRRVLRNEHDAEDVLQAAFLVLARKASELAGSNSIAGWLHTVAYHLALKARGAAARRPADRPAEELEAMIQLKQRESNDIGGLLDDELNRLPRCYRDPLVLCCLEGLSREEAARQLGWTTGAVKGRLERARSLLRSRLLARGVPLGAVGRSPLFDSEIASAAAFEPLRPELAQRALKSALAFVNPHHSATGGAASVHAVALAEGVLHHMAMHKIKLTAALVASLALLGGWGALSWSGRSGEPESPNQANLLPPLANAAKDAAGDPLPNGATARLGSIRFRHPEDIYFAALADQDRLLVTAGHDYVIRVWRLDDGQEIRQIPLPNDDGGPNAPGGKRAGIAGLRLSGAVPASLAMSPDGKTLAIVGIGSGDKAVQFWDVTTGKNIRSLKDKDTESVVSFLFTFSPDGKLLAGMLAKNRAVVVWDAESGKVKSTCLVPRDDQNKKLGGNFVRLAGNAAPVVAFSPDGKLVAVTTTDIPDPTDPEKKPQGRLFLFDTDSGKIQNKIDATAGSQLASIAWSVDGKHLAWNDGEGKVWVHDLPANKTLRSFSVCKGFTRDLAFLPTSDGIVVRTPHGGIRAFDLEGKELWKLGEEVAPVREDTRIGRIIINSMVNDPYNQVHPKLAISADGKKIVGVRSQAAECWSVETKALVPGIDSHLTGVRGIVHLDDGKTAATWSRDGTVRFWTLADGRTSRVFKLPVAALHGAVSSDGNLVAFASGRNKVELWDTVKNKRLHELESQPSGVSGLTFSPDGAFLAARGVDADPKLLVWKTATGEVVARLAERGEEGGNAPGVVAIGATPLGTETFNPSGMAFSPNGQAIALHAGDQVKLWDYQRGKELLVINLPANDPRAMGRPRVVLGGASFMQSSYPLAYSPDGRLLAVGIAAKVLVYETATGKVRVELHGHDRAIHALTFLSANVLATGGTDKTLRLWDVADNKELAKLTGHLGEITAVEATKDGLAIVTGSQDTTCLVWSVKQYVLGK